MKVNVEALRETLVQIGLPPEVAKAMDPSKPMLEQGMDSVDFPAFCVALEDQFKTGLGDDDVLKLHSLNDFVEFIGTLK